MESPKNNNYIVIHRGWLISAAVGVITFFIGGAIGYFLATTTYDRGLNDAADAFEEIVTNNPAQAAAPSAAEPTALPDRLEEVSVDDDPFLGDEDAPVTIVEFSDFHCPYCGRFAIDTLPQILDEYGDQVRFVYRDFPVVGGNKSAEAAQCANEQGGYWEYHDALFANIRGYTTADAYASLADSLGLDGEALRECVESGKYNDELMNDYNDGRAYGVSGTPTFFINGVRVVGAQPLEVFQQIIEEELNNPS